MGEFDQFWDDEVPTAVSPTAAKDRLFERSVQKLQNRVRRMNPEDFNMVYMGDSWVGDGHTSDYVFEDAIAAAMIYNPLCLFHGGDLVFTGEQALLASFAAKVEALAPDLPVFTLIGNHDLQKISDTTGSPENYESIIGPPHYDLDIPALKLKFIGLNSMYHYKFDEYGFTDEELAYLKTELNKSSRYNFVSMHTPPKAGVWATSDHTFTIGMKPFLDIVRGKASKVLVSHIHGYNTDQIAGTDFILSGGGGAALELEQINHIVVLKMKGGKVLQKRVPV